MPHSIQSLLDAFPEAVVQLREGLVLAANEKARQYLPRLTLGAPLPVALPLPSPGENQAGSFIFDSSTYTYTSKSGPEGTVLLFRPNTRSALENWQLDGVLQQLRGLLGEILAEVGPATVPGGQVSADTFSKSFHRLFRLINNMEFMQRAAAGELSFHPVTMDLDGLCRDTALLAERLLREAGVSLSYSLHDRRQGLLIPGDPRLLRQLLLGLISNAARAMEAGQVVLFLRRSGDSALLTISNSLSQPGREQLDALLRGSIGEGPPRPGQGAGLGLPIAQHIVRMHGGRLLPFSGETSPGVAVLLPTGPLNGHVSVRTPPAVQWDGGLDPVLVELSDVLPASLFGMEGLD